MGCIRDEAVSYFARHYNWSSSLGSGQWMDAAETIFIATAEFKARLNQSSDAPF